MAASYASRAVVLRSSQFLGSRGHVICTNYRHASTGSSKYADSFYRYWKKLKWVPIPLGLGFAYIGYQQMGHIVKREEQKIKSKDPDVYLAKDWQVTLYRKMPLKSMSRLWGKVNDLNLPVWLRSPVYKLYIWCFNCNLQEAAIEDLAFYKNLGEFFRRKLKPSCRPVDTMHCLVSPSDGKVLHYGTVEKGVLEQVKGVTYSLEAFLGPKTWDQDLESKVDENSNVNNNVSNNASVMATDGLSESNNVMKPDFLPLKEDYHQNIMVQPGNDLYHCIIYLAPGDYHRFHSPTDWTVRFRRHFPGELFSVNPGIARWIRGLFNFNERAVYYGQWKHGFMSMAAVGATNVGSIKVYCDGDLMTNCGGKWPAGTYFDETIAPSSGCGMEFGKGEHFGEFRLGSTLVMVFEAPKSFKFHIQAGQKIKFGQPLGSTEEELTKRRMAGEMNGHA